MVGLGFYFIFLFGLAFYLISTGRHPEDALVALGAGVHACHSPGSPPRRAGSLRKSAASPGWSKACLPTFLAVSSLTANNVLVTLIGFVGFYSALLLVDVYLMIKAIRLGPGDIVPEPRALAMPAASGAE